MATADNHKGDEIVDNTQLEELEKKELETARAAAELSNALAGRDTALPETPPQRAESGSKNMLDKEYPRAAELKRDTPTLPKIPSKVSLKDIALPEYMKGPARGEGKPTQDALLSQSAREIGMGPTRQDSPERKNIVSVSPENRTEIDDNGLPKIRTYASDMNREMKRRGATLTTIVGEERERMARQKIQKENTPAVPKRNIVFILGALALVGIGIASVVAAFILTKKDTLPVPAIKLINTNAQKIVLLDDTATLPELLADARATADIALGEVEDFVIVRNGALLSPEEILTLLGAPATLARNATAIMVGVHSFDRNQPFIIATTSFYDLSYQAMLLWEKSIAETLGGFFKPVNASAIPPPLVFSDAIFKNIDIRTSNATWPIVYSFPAKDLLIITTNQNTLNEILTRLSISSAR